MILERSVQPTNCTSFVTLTYAPEYYPPTGSLDVMDYKRFLWSLRNNDRKTSGKNFRYFGCGEYGDKFGRAHYHFVLFGHHVDIANQMVQRAWQKGHTDVGLCTGGGMKYIAGYVQKKLTGEAAEKEYGERLPPFATMSRNPGIGAVATDRIIDKLKVLKEQPDKVEFGNDVFQWYAGRIMINGYTYSLPDYCINRILKAFSLETDVDQKRIKGHIEWLKELYSLDEYGNRRAILDREYKEREALNRMKANI